MTPKHLSRSGLQMRTQGIGNVRKAILRSRSTMPVILSTVLMVTLSASYKAQTSEAHESRVVGATRLTGILHAQPTAEAGQAEAQPRGE